MAGTVQQLSRPRVNTRLFICGAVALGLHGLVLGWAGSHPEGAAQTQARPGRAVAVRLMSAAVPLNASEPAAIPIDPQPAADTALGDTSLSAQGGDSTTDLNGYVPRRWLTVGPKPLAPILLPFPAGFQERARYTVVLNLYIEADGRVGRIEFVGVPLPELLERTARNAFEQARFSPGQVKGRTVKSLIQVEVDFDALGAG